MKGLRVAKSVKEMKSEGVWGELEVKKQNLSQNTWY